MGYMDTQQWRHEAVQRDGGGGYVGSSTEARDIEGSQPKQPYVRTRVPERERAAPPDQHQGNNYIQRARRLHM